MSNELDYRFENQVRLLLEILPIVLQNRKFALKGGTAINLFVRDLPRLSGAIVRPTKPFDSEKEIKLLVEYNYTSIKIEPNYILRGCVFPPREQKV